MTREDADMVGTAQSRERGVLGAAAATAAGLARFRRSQPDEGSESTRSAELSFVPGEHGRPLDLQAPRPSMPSTQAAVSGQGRLGRAVKAVTAFLRMERRQPGESALVFAPTPFPSAPSGDATSSPVAKSVLPAGREPSPLPAASQIDAVEPRSGEKHAVVRRQRHPRKHSRGQVRH
jgi:hypothetical protein